MGEPSIERALQFMRLLHVVHGVERTAITPPNGDRYENVAEHTFQVAMLSWYIASAANLALDMERVLKYALAHDLVEAYAGDTYFQDAAAQATKVAREGEARKRLAVEFPDFEELHEVLQAYERREDIESRFVYALDKMTEPFNNVLNNGEPQRSKGITFDFMKAYKRPKVAEHEVVARLFEDLLDHIERIDPELALFAHEQAAASKT